MAHVATGSVVRQLGSLFEGGSVAGLSDRQLLERFTAGGREPAGEAAFAALVARHGPMVLGVCRQLLGDVSMPRTPSRPSSWSWPGRPGRSATPTCWATGCTGSRSGRRGAPGSRSPAADEREEGDAMRGPRCRRRAEPRPRRPTGRRSTASRPRPSTARSTACRGRSGCRWCSATSRASRSTRPPGGSDARPARSAAGWPGRARSSAAA